MLNIYIPSYRRHEKQTTFENIPDDLKKKTFIVVSDTRDFISYKRRYGPSNVLNCHQKGIASTRQWIIDTCPVEYAMMIDDDMNFSVRSEGKLVRCNNKDLKQMFALMESWLKEGLVHVGISQRFGNNRIDEDSVEVTRMNNVYAYNCSEMRKLKKDHGVAFDALEKKTGQILVMEDFQITLHLLSLGYKNRVTYKYCWGQRKSGDTGGCSIYRDYEMQNTSANLIAKEYPSLCRIVEKESNTEWKGIGKVRTDLHIYWKKAFKSRVRKNIRNFL